MVVTGPSEDNIDIEGTIESYMTIRRSHRHVDKTDVRTERL
jgi:hypothetical protein